MITSEGLVTETKMEDEKKIVATVTVGKYGDGIRGYIAVQVGQLPDALLFLGQKVYVAISAQPFKETSDGIEESQS